MKPGQKIDLGMTGYAELFMSDEERKTQTLPRIVDIPIELVDDFPDHPFKVRMDEDMQQLVESIRERGMITPVILRKKEDGRACSSGNPLSIARARKWTGLTDSRCYPAIQRRFCPRS